MTNEEIKKMLYNYKKIDIWIADCEKELQEIQEKINTNYDVGIAEISDMPHGTGISDKTFNAAARIEKLKETFAERVDYLNNKIKQYYDDKKNIEQIVEKLGYLQREVVEKKYFRNLSWQEIIEEDKKNNPRTCKSIDMWYKTHQSAIKEIKKMLDNKKTGD